MDEKVLKRGSLLGTQYLLPIMLAVMMAKWVGDYFGPAIYEEISELKSIPFLEHHTPHSTFMKTATQVMAENVICIQEVERLDFIIQVRRRFLVENRIG
jgi:chloride channel 7